MDSQERYINGFDPGSPFIIAEAPPFLSHSGVGALSANGREQNGRDQCDVKWAHPGVREQIARAGTDVQPLLSKVLLDSSA